ncbi:MULTISPECIES: helix-turn-helix domain-containing protein [unclassified Lonepinella]|uniref:helix-turn-helix domain-containing protein n=1 Tax=unclassified Lonepinella TaxID=2642006 RepID=UPI0036DE23CA
MKTLGEKIKEFRNQLGLNQVDFAKKCGEIDSRDRAWGQSRIGNYETNAREPSLDDIRIIAKALGISPADLAFTADNITPVILKSNKVPLISYVQAGMWTEVNLMQDSEDFEYILTDLDVSENAFALKIKGDSMEPDFIEGDTIIVDPKVKPHAGEFVVAKNGEYEATFKKYRPLQDYNEYGNQHFELVALNPDYDKLTTLKQDIRIVGTMVEHRIYRRKR